MSQALVERAQVWGGKVAARRRLLGLTQAQLADLCEENGRRVEQQTISKIENGEIECRDSVKEVVAAALRTTVPKLFPWDLKGAAA